MSVELYSAGAGTGKTYRLCEAVAERMAKGLHARHLLATTFTKAAAAELKTRAQGHLLRLGKVAEAEALEFALIGTVHSVGLQLVRRYWLQLGLTSDVEVLPEGEDAALLREAMGALDPTLRDRLTRISARLSQPERVLLDLLKIKRQNAVDDEDLKAQLTKSAERFAEVLGARGGKETFADAGAAAQAAAKTALTGLAGVPGHKDLKCYRALMTLTRSKPSSWAELTVLAKLEETKKSGADGLLEPIRAFGATIARHPGLRADLLEYAQALGSAVVDLGAHYSTCKGNRGLLDYVDLEVLFLKLITDPKLRTELREEIKFVVVDEFQDTYPVQLAIFEALTTIADDCIWVGDPKQAIYGFAGTDPRLMAAAMKRAAKAIPLTENRRSEAGLVDLFNEMFAPMFGEGSRVSAHRTGAGAVERWLLEGRNKDDDQQAIAHGVAELIAGGASPSEIAILTRKNEYAQQIAQALLKRGISAIAETPGLLATRECATSVAALRLAADRRDGVAAALLLDVLTDEPWLELRLKEAAKDGLVPFSGHPLISRIENLDHRALSPSAAVAAVIDALGLPDRCAIWGDADVRGANLDSLLGLAEEYEDGILSAGRACTLAGFLAHLDDLEADKDDVRSPQVGLEAVTIMTYHKAKGLEWPVVILAELDKGSEPRLWLPTASGGKPEAGKPLEGRAIRFWPFPFGDYDRLGIADTILQSSEGVEASRAAVEEATRLLYVGFTRAKDRLVLATRVQPLKKGDKHCHSWLDEVPSFGTLLGAATAPGTHAVKNVKAKLTVKRIVPPSEVEVRTVKQRWLSIPAERKGAPVARFVNPSDAVAVPVKCRAEALPGGLVAGADAEIEERSDLGQAVHAYFAALPSLVKLGRPDKLGVARRILVGFGVSAALSAEDLVQAGDAFDQWRVKHGNATVWTEVPLSAPANGSRSFGIVDMLLDGQELTLIDHKSARAKSAAHAAIAGRYAGQLTGYGDTIEKSHGRRPELWIHLPLSAGAVKVER